VFAIIGKGKFLKIFANLRKMRDAPQHNPENTSVKIILAESRQATHI
jgi:hypothetical protein